MLSWPFLLFGFSFSKWRNKLPFVKYFELMTFFLLLLISFQIHRHRPFACLLQNISRCWFVKLSGEWNYTRQINWVYFYIPFFDSVIDTVFLRHCHCSIDIISDCLTSIVIEYHIKHQNKYLYVCCVWVS